MPLKEKKKKTEHKNSVQQGILFKASDLNKLFTFQSQLGIVSSKKL